MSSPSRPASHALTTLSTSSRRSWSRTTFICFSERSSRTTSLKWRGTIGRGALPPLLELVVVLVGLGELHEVPDGPGDDVVGALQPARGLLARAGVLLERA